MPNNWKKYKLTDLGTLARGKSKNRPRDAAFLYGGPYPFIQTGDIKGSNHRIYNYTQTYSEAGLQQSKLWPKDTICLTIAANIGDTAILNFPACFPDSVLGFIADKTKCDVEFIEYLLQHYKKEIQSHSIGSVQDNINLGTFENVEFTLPPLPEQQAIAEILSSLDDKIELNLQTNKTLEEMANALYKHWFVDFGPFKNGKFIESELGMIPEGWGASKVNTLYQITIGRTPPRKEQEWFSRKPSDVKWISIKDMGIAETYIYNTSEYLTKEAVVKHNVPKIPTNTVVLSFKLTVGRITITTEEMLSNEAIAHFVPMKNNYLSTEYTYLFLKNFNYDSLGSTSSIATAVNSQTIKNIFVLLPDSKTIELFQANIYNLFSQIKHNTLETETLKQTRDYLLPKLISGEIQVKQAAKLAKQVL